MFVFGSRSCYPIIVNPINLKSEQNNPLIILDYSPLDNQSCILATAGMQDMYMTLDDPSSCMELRNSFPSNCDPNEI